MQQESQRIRTEGGTIGFVPTMGALHEGHLSLVRRSAEENDTTVVSVFVNPTQFGPGEDLEQYPRDPEGDEHKAAEAGADIVFAPSIEDMYLPAHATIVDVGGNLTNTLCGLSRPGHFRGVAIVVSKLFNIVLPHRAYFGRKDYQQLRVVSRMAEDLNFPVEIVPMPTVREKDGLAVSSRNRYLTEEERTDARVLKEALDHFRQRVEEGERDTLRLVSEMTALIHEVPSAEIDYVSIVNADTLEDVERLDGRVLAALAVKIGGTRLIDNTVVEI